MTKAHDDYKKLDTPAGSVLAECPVCGANAELWQYSISKDAPTTKAVMCTNGDTFGPQDGILNSGCLLYMPPEDFYQGRIVAAIDYWNAYAKALTEQQRNRRWKRSKVLRTETGHD